MMILSPEILQNDDRNKITPQLTEKLFRGISDYTVDQMNNHAVELRLLLTELVELISERFNKSETMVYDPITTDLYIKFTDFMKCSPEVGDLYDTVYTLLRHDWVGEIMDEDGSMVEVSDLLENRICKAINEQEMKFPYMGPGFTTSLLMTVHDDVKNGTPIALEALKDGWLFPKQGCTMQFPGATIYSTYWYALIVQMFHLSWHVTVEHKRRKEAGAYK